MEGIINFDKPARISSAAALNRIKHLLARGTKVGHAGTLDPFATGVLLVLVGRAVKQSQFLMDQPKQYETTVKLGATTDTDDPTSEEKMVAGDAILQLEQIQQSLKTMVGIVSQLPPKFCALKIGGRRAYDLARQGKPVELKPREVQIDAIEILGWDWPLLKLRIDCGRGTYIRAIARDIGEKLGVGGYLLELRRTRVGRFDTGNGVTLEQIERDGVAAHLQPAVV